MTPTDNTRNVGPVRAASTLNILAGIWLFVSPWVYGAYTNPNAWNSWIVGAVIVILAAIRMGSPAGLRGFSWFNCFLGAWTFASPWIYGYMGNTGRFVNSLCVGVIVFLLAIAAATSMPRISMNHPAHPSPRM
jgi:hypothetical protein